MSTTAETLNFFRDLLKGEEHSHPYWSRLLAASWGSGVLHGAVLVYTLSHQNFKGASDIAGRLDNIDNYIIALGYFFVLAAIIIYSLTFGLTVAASLPKSSLIRHFVYGVLLPAFAYSMARIALWREIAGEIAKSGN